MEGLSKLGSYGSGTGVVAGLATGNLPLALGSAASFVASKSMNPRTYFQVVGAAKLPGQASRALIDSFKTGKASVIKNTLETVAEQYPEEATRLVTQLAALSQASEKQSMDAIKRRIGGGK